MTADLYATAAGLIERSAAAYVSGVREAAGDDGFFGPVSVPRPGCGASMIISAVSTR
jgi:hypothetical protein